MRFGFGLVGLLVALAIVGVLVKKQMSATKLTAQPALSAPASGASAPQNAREQSQLIQEQFKQQLDSALQQGQQRLDSEAQ
ncbi:hypothetical protein G7048_21490 [Diaphorobacter sp. HDW4B]|uniref:hypothetical protein n=1 Tax=Diaphorobacter sp. HDW4B TaxID=2714925 RepID=UPI0014077B81|nr:hypothetical protein [Diaphorobacter sp. HDW4B]QIL72697.1 hypothetical protein G7048_21490 [Diaphorobacter sp. HDW4B]